MKRLLAFILATAIVLTTGLTVFADTATNSEAENESSGFVPTVDLEIDAAEAYLCDAQTGTVLYAKNENERRSPASVTKVMTLLLVCEALGEGAIKLDDKVSVSAYAASMGGSQVFLEEGERFSVEELIKCTVIASANDAAVALAEYCAGSEAAFVSKMNERARLLGLTNTSFENVTGLDDETVNHYTTARDIAVMSRELIKHDVILKYSSVWQDTIRDGEFTLTNTNRLVRYYDGCNGLKTGSTDKAGYCVSATAERDGLTLIAVVMGAESRDKRNAAARAMLDYGFSSFALYCDGAEYLEDVPVLSGKSDGVAAVSEGFTALAPKAKLSKVEKHFDIPESLEAPIKKGDVIGSIVYTLDGAELGRADIYADSDVEKITFIDIYLRILSNIFSGV